jgi:hypothetical protein
VQLSPAWYNWTESYNDFFLWYHKPLMEKCGVNGTWWDNASLGTIREYNPETGQMELKFNLWQRRQLMKRLNHLGWELMRPPMWVINMHAVDLAFNQRVWQIENDWRSTQADFTAFDAFPLDRYRAMTRTRSTMLIVQPAYGGYFRDRAWEKHPDPAHGRKIGRSLRAIMMMHDVGGVPGFDVSDTGRCLFTGYWSAARYVQTPDADIKASFYSNPWSKKAAVILVNVAKRDQSLKGTVLNVDSILSAARPHITTEPLAIKRVYDLESGRDLKSEKTAEGAWRLAEDLTVPWHEYVIVGIEVE